MELAPIVLFVYNRPWHTEQTLNALMQNELANQSALYIFADGPKPDADEKQLNDIADVRNLIRSKKWCKEVKIIEALANKGLADSIVDGVTKIVNKYGRVIVLEDDIVTSRGFLKYMNEALNFYANQPNVFHISGYMFPIKGKLPETFFYRQTSCWGWATWDSKWKYLNKSAPELLEKMTFSGKIKEADIDGTNQFLEQLNGNIEGRIKTWAVFWHFSVALKDGLCLHPGRSLVNNIGQDSSGSNSGSTNIFNVKTVDNIKVKAIPIVDYSKIYVGLKEFYGNKMQSKYTFNIVKRIKTIIPSKIKRELKMISNKRFRDTENEKVRIKNLPRYTETELEFLGKKIRIPDIASFQFIKKEIFEQLIYKFESKNSKPFIIDCGANIGLSVIYFKNLFPQAEVVAFEPDDKIYKILAYNIESFGFTGVRLIKKACWWEETILKFYSEGADGGRAAHDFDTTQISEVETVKLSGYIKGQKVDFLKIDIEGAEKEVLSEIRHSLGNVSNIFIEYHSFSGQEQSLPEILTILKEAGFRIYVSSPGLHSSNPFIHVNTYLGMDNQLNIYGVRH